MWLSWNARWAVLAAGASLVFVVSAAAWAAEVNKTPAAKPAVENQPDPFAVPAGTPDQLLQYLDGLRQQRPSGETLEAQQEFVQKRNAAMLTATEKILAAKPTPEQAQRAVETKLTILQMAAMYGGVPDAAKKLEAFPGELEAAGFKNLAREARLILLQSRLRQVFGMNNEERAKLLAEVKTVLSGASLDRSALGLAMEAANIAEHTGQTPWAVQLYNDLGKRLSASQDKQQAHLGAVMQGAARRLELVGKAMVLTGNRIDGKALDWKQYQGKVVLVDFFATWCGPCRAEVPNIEKNYAAYHGRGFDVITVSLDQDRKALEKFLEEHKHPWTVLVDDPQAGGTENPMAVYYGVFGIPQLILVGQDGKVVTLNARGAELGRQLERLLGPVEKAKEPAKTGLTPAPQRD